VAPASSVQKEKVNEHCRVPRALTVAGSDSGAGAGIQADLKTFFALGVYGTCAITAVTAQNTQGVTAVHYLPPEMVAEQIDAVVADIGCDAVKTGMLGTAAIVEVVAAKILEHRLKNLVVDPVMVAKSGHLLLDPAAVSNLAKQLLPLARVVTPNLAEAEVLAQMQVTGTGNWKEAAKRIAGLGARYVLITGGHLPGPAVDLLYDGREFMEVSSARIETTSTHGTGCTYSAAIAAGLARGLDVPEAVRVAKEYVHAALKGAFPLGKGHGPTNHWAGYQAHGAGRTAGCG